MSNMNSIRLKAAHVRNEILMKNGLGSDALVDPQRLIELASDHFDIIVSPASKDSQNLQGSVAVLRNGLIFFDQGLNDGYRQYCIAHELGHHVLHQKTDECTESDIRDFSSDDEAPSAVQEIQGYGSRERREREANLFALEFILPLEVARAEFLSSSGGFGRIQELTKLSPSLIYGQLATALLIPKAAVVEHEPPTEVKLDDSQLAAARVETGPVLLTAGPGTGKTQTLVHRILFLIEEKKIDPEKILALTFSNKAAQEMRERIAHKAPEAAPKMSVMTFHGYALELLRKFWKEAGLQADSEIIERLEAISYLERHLDELDLDHFQDIENPPAKLPIILNWISRAKDELVSPEEFLEQVELEAQEAQTEEQEIRIEELREIARVYAFYQKFLDETKQLDYGEIIFQAVKLIQGNPQLKASLRKRYDAVLVDEFQDINRASGLLVKEIAGDGHGLWAVGDLRQSIYRWRGASTSNIKQFEVDYPGTTRLSLTVNYRSGKEVVEIFSEFAKEMIAVEGSAFEGWSVRKSDAAEVRYHIADDLAGEASFIAEESIKNSRNGIPFKDQAVLCRSNPQLSKIAEHMVASGVPVLFLGDIFERPEIKDLMAFLEVVASEKGFGLARLADFPEHPMTPVDVSLVAEASCADNMDFQAYLAGGEFPDQMSEAGRKGLAALRETLAQIPKDVSAYSALAHYLFRNESFIRRILAIDNEVLRAQKLLAIYQLFNLAKTVEERFFSAEDREKQIEKFLNHIRRLIAFKEDRNLYNVPESASELDAVRLLTVHKSKGLEFDVVYLPFLGKGQFPGKDKDDAGYLPRNVEPRESEHLEEEECLFFVAMSRARKKLHLSRSNRYSSGRTTEASVFLDKLQTKLPGIEEIGALWDRDRSESLDKRFDGYHEGDVFISEMNRYEKCPRSFYYRNVLKLKGKKSDSVYRKFHNLVYQTIGEIQATLRKRETVTLESALATLDLYWQLAEMDSEPYARIYRKQAEEMIRVVVAKIGETHTEVIATRLTMTLEHGSVSAKPDHLEMVSVEEGVLIRSFMTRKEPEPGKRLDVENKEVVFRVAAQTQFHSAPVKILRTYLKTDSDREINITDRVLSNRTVKMNENLAAMRNGHFPAKPSEHNCPKCMYFFICDQK